MDPITIAMGLAQFAPAILKYLTGSDKAEQVASKVIEVAQAVTGATSPLDAVAAVSADPAIQLEFRKAVMANELEWDRAYLADRKDARGRDVAIVQAGKTNTRANFMVAMDVVGLLASLAGMLALGWVKAKHADAITEGVFGALLAQLSTMASYFGLCLRDAHQFEFGSSRGSQDKTDLLAKAPPIPK